MDERLLDVGRPHLKVRWRLVVKLVWNRLVTVVHLMSLCRPLMGRRELVENVVW